MLLLTRTNLDVPKHKGLTMFILPMDTPGITVEPVHTMGTERTNATFYDDVRDRRRVALGEVDGGWKVMGVALVVRAGRDGRHRGRDAAAAPLPRVGRRMSSATALARSTTRSSASGWSASPSTTRSPRC